MLLFVFLINFLFKCLMGGLAYFIMAWALSTWGVESVLCFLAAWIFFWKSYIHYASR